MSTIEPTDGGAESTSATELGDRTTATVREGESVTVAVVEALCETLDASPADIDPLYESVDPDALDSLFAPVGDDGRPHGRLSFVHDGCAVTVHAGGELLVTALDD